MDKIEKVLQLLNSDEIGTEINSLYDLLYTGLKPELHDKELFLRYFKGFILDKYLTLEDEDRTLILNSLTDHQINTGMVEKFIDVFNGSIAKVHDSLDGVTFDYFKSLLKYRNNTILKLLEPYETDFDIITKENNGLLTIDEIKRGEYPSVYTYRLDEEEIKQIEMATMVPGIITLVHSLYDDLDDQRLVCNYDDIDDELLRNLVPHTDRKNPNFNILFPNGIIVNYYMGDIRIRPIRFQDLVFFIKLAFVDNYYNGDNNDTYNFLLEEYNIDSIDYDNVDPELIQILINIASEIVGGQLEALEQTFSQKMIDDAKGNMERIKTLVVKYKI